MGAYDQYSKMFRNGIVAKAKELGYSADNICILENGIEQLATRHPQTYQNLLSCKHNRDHRTPITYARDLVASWIFEDTLVKALADGGLDSSLAGADRNRQLLPTSKVSASSDTLITHEGNCRYLEIMCDYTGYWERTGVIDLRDDKFLKLANEHALFLGVSTKTNKYILLDFALPPEAKFIPQHPPYGYKPAYSIKIDTAAMKKFLMPPLIADLQNKLNAS